MLHMEGGARSSRSGEHTPSSRRASERERAASADMKRPEASYARLAMWEEKARDLPAAALWVWHSPQIVVEQTRGVAGDIGTQGIVRHAVAVVERDQSRRAQAYHVMLGGSLCQT